MVTMTSESNSDKASSSLTKKSNVLTAPTTASISEVAPNILVYKKVIATRIPIDAFVKLLYFTSSFSRWKQ